MNLFLILKLVTVSVFLVMFLRGSRLVWGVGLLTVTTAVMLDTIFGAFGREDMLAQLGFFFHVISGALFAGAAVWLWGWLRPLAVSHAPVSAHSRLTHQNNHDADPRQLPATADPSGTAFDRQMLYDQIRYRFGPDDVYDLIFDLGINENDVVGANQEMRQVILSVMDLAEQRGQTSALALAVERILMPLPAEHLPRLEKLSEDSPHTVLRQFLLANYSLDQLAQMTTALGIDWEHLEGNSKKAKVRALLLYLYRRNRLDELIDLMQEPIR